MRRSAVDSTPLFVAVAVLAIDCCGELVWLTGDVVLDALPPFVLVTLALATTGSLRGLLEFAITLSIFS